MYGTLDFKTVPTSEEAKETRSKFAQKILETPKNPENPIARSRREVLQEIKEDDSYKFSLLRHTLDKIPNDTSVKEKTEKIAELLANNYILGTIPPVTLSDVLTEYFDESSYEEVIDELIENKCGLYISEFIFKSKTQKLGDIKEKLIEKDQGTVILELLNVFPGVDPEELVKKLFEEKKFTNLHLYLSYINDSEEALSMAEDLIVNDPYDPTIIPAIINNIPSALDENFLVSVLDSRMNSIIFPLASHLEFLVVTNPSLITSKVLNGFIDSGYHQEVENVIKSLKSISAECCIKLMKQNPNFYNTSSAVNILSKIEDLNKENILEILELIPAELAYTITALKYRQEIFTQELINKLANINSSEVLKLVYSIPDLNYDEVYQILKSKGTELDEFSCEVILKNYSIFPSVPREELEIILDKLVQPNSLPLFQKSLIDSIDLLSISQREKLYQHLLSEFEFSKIIENIGFFGSMDRDELQKKLELCAEWGVLVQYQHLFPNLTEQYLIDQLSNGREALLLKNIHKFPSLNIEKLQQDLISQGKVDLILENSHIFKNVELNKLVEILVSKGHYSDIFSKWYSFRGLPDDSVYKLLNQAINSGAEDLVVSHISKFSRHPKINEILDLLIEKNYGLSLYLRMLQSDNLTDQIYEKLKKFEHFQLTKEEIDGVNFKVYSNNPYSEHPWNSENVDLNYVKTLSQMIMGTLSEEETRFLGLDDLESQQALIELRKIIDSEFESFMIDVKNSDSISEIEKLYIFGESTKELEKIKNNIIRNLARYIYQSTEGDPKKIKLLFTDTEVYLSKFSNESQKVLSEEQSVMTQISGNFNFYKNTYGIQMEQRLGNTISDRDQHKKELKGMSLDFRSLIKKGFEKYISVYRNDVPLYDLAFKEFDELRLTTDFPKEVYLGRDGIYALIGRRALITHLLRKMGREERKKLYEKIPSHMFNPTYLVYPRFFVENMDPTALKKYLEQYNVDSSNSPLFFDTGYTGTIPENIMRIIKIDKSEVDSRIKLLSSSNRLRLVRGIYGSRWTNPGIVDLIERNAKVEGAAEGLYLDSSTGKLKHIARPLCPEQQFLFAEIKEALERHYWLSQKIGTKENAFKLLQRGNYQELLESLSLFQKVDHNEIVLEALKKNQAQLVSRYLGNAADLNSDVAKILIKTGYYQQIFENISSFKNLSIEVAQILLSIKHWKDRSSKQWILDNKNYFEITPEFMRLIQ